MPRQARKLIGNEYTFLFGTILCHVRLDFSSTRNCSARNVKFRVATVRGADNTVAVFEMSQLLERVHMFNCIL